MFDLALVAALSDAGLRRSEASSLTCRIVQVGALGQVWSRCALRF